ncbi:hypothetical protein PR001_g18824 [Phytophthora rubi]|uniref:Protein kinase domain-containing protein n=1 Tax=Phytophthora rubi TaxID=129364 RepID=A0A6A3K8S2_9STRA|nr:hypothetical protein PR001_g18824 [Phytophthora rubi]
MKEATHACKRLHARLGVVFNTLENTKVDDANGVCQTSVEVVSKFLQFLERYHGKELVHRVVEHSTMMDQLRYLHEEVAMLFELLNIAPASNWGEEWEEDHRLQKQVLAATVKSCAVVQSELQDPRDRAEALLLLKFEVEQRGERNDDDVLGLMKSMLASVLMTSKTAEEPLPPWFLPLYELEYEPKPFARRSTGTLHRGVWGDQTNVAIKFFLVDDEVLDERMQRQLEKELEIIFPLNHPNVGRMFGASHISVSPFVVLEYAANGSLSSFLASSETHKEQMWRLLYEAALGLSHIHEKSIVHGNLKLSNILVDVDGHAKLSDVGLLRMRTCSILSQTKHEGSTSNNLRWRAPECLKRRPTFSSDIYSFAMCIIEAVIGEPPFAFLSDDDVRDNLRKREIPDKPNEMTDEMWELVVAMTNSEPAKRVGIKVVLDRLKVFAGKATYEPLKATDASSHDRLLDQHCPRAESAAVVIDSSTIWALASASVEEQDSLLQQMVEECISDGRRSHLYELNGVPALISLTTSSVSHFTQVCALLILSWVAHLDLSLPKQDLEAHRTVIRAPTQLELDRTKDVLRGGNDQAKLKAAMYCAGLGTVMKGKELRDSGLVSALVEVLKNENDAVKLWAAVAVGRFANNDVDRTTIANKGAIVPLLVLLQAGTPPQKLWASYALAKLCQDNETNSVAIANSGAIPLLMTLLQDGSERQKEFAALALGHLAFASDNSSAMIASAGAVALLVSLLRTGSGRQKERAGFALGSLMSRSIDNCTAIEVDGGIELLVSLLLNGTDLQKESAAFALSTFVARGDVKSNATELEEASSYLISLLTTGTNAQKEIAALTLGTFSVGTNASVLAVTLERAISSLVSLLRDGAKGPQEQATFALSHLAGMSDSSRIAIAGDGVISAFISLLQLGNDSLKEHAALGLGNLALNNTVNCNEIVRGGAIPLLNSLLADGTEKQKRYAALAIGNLAASGNSNSVALANSGALVLLMTLLRSGSEALKEAAAFAMARLAVNEANCMIMVHDGAVSSLVALLQSGNDRQKEQAAYALSEFADKSYANCALIVREGGISHLVELLRVGTDKQKEFAAMSLSFICGEDELAEHRVAISRAGAISPLVALLRSGSDPHKRWAALALGSLAVKDDANCVVIERDGAIPPLIALLRSSLDRHKENAAFALGRLAAFSSDVSVVSALEDATAPLVELVQMGTEAQKEEAAFALGHLALKSDASCETMAKNGGISVLTALLRAGNEKHKAFATMALVNLAANNRNIHAQVVNEGVVGLLVDLQRTGMRRRRSGRRTP